MNIDEIHEGLKNEIQALKDKKRELVKEFFGKKSEAIFDKHPDLKSFGFLCYALYFNDGDVCDFNVHTDIENGLRINGLKDDELYTDCKYDTSTRQYEYTFAEGVPVEAIKDVQKFLNSIDSEDYEDMFGNDTEISVTRDGVTIDSYTSHD